MENPIKYEDLFDPKLIADVQALSKELGVTQQNLLAMLNTAKEAGLKLKVSLNSSTGKTKETAATIDEVNAQYKKWKISLDEVNAEMKKLDSETGAVTFTQKEMNKVVKLGNEYNSARANSYAQLSKKYSAMKILINQLTEEERKNTEQGKLLVNNARQIYEQMNAMQQATGKYQLQVGNYSKAMNGLNLATNQVVRELPVLANGMTMFIMAISNNLPIFFDAIKAFKEQNAALAAQKAALMASADAQERAAGAAIKLKTATQAIVGVLKSWQTIMILVLTVLPMVIRGLKNKKKAVLDLNNTMKETINLENTFYRVQEATHKGYQDNVQVLRMLYMASQDLNRSEDERLRLAELLRKEYKDEFSRFSTEAILAGEAKEAYDKLTESIHRQARAKAILNTMTENEQKKIELEIGIEKYMSEHDIQKSLKTIDKLQEERKEHEKWLKASDAQTRGQAQKRIKEIDDAIAKIREGNKEYFDTLKEIGDIDVANKWLLGQMKAIDFATLFKGNKDMEKVVEILGMPFIEFNEQADKYFRQNWKAEIDAMEDGMEKELALNDYKYQTMIEDLESFLGQQELLEQEGHESISKEQMQFIRDTIAIWRQQYYDEMDRIVTEWNTKHPDMKFAIPGFEGIDEKHPKYKPTEETGKKKKDIWEKMGFGSERDFRKFLKALEKAFNITFDYMKKWMDMRMEMAKIATEAATKEVESAKEALDLEQQARVNGYAHNVGLARMEYEEKLAAQKKAIEEEQRLAKIQQGIDAASQVSSLLVATANLWANYSKIPVGGAVLAGIATAAMWGSFAAAQVKANQLVNAKTEKFGEGMSEYLDYGGSHASGNDIDFGTMKDGTRRRVERGEMVAVINKKNVEKYGKENIASIMTSLNSGTFEDKYGLAFAGMSLASASADLTKVEDGIGKLVRQGEKRVLYADGCRIEYSKNRKRIIRN